VASFGETYESFSVSNPQPGDWIVEVFGLSVPSGSATFTVSSIQLAGSPVVPPAGTDDPVATAVPVISGVPRLGERLSVSSGAWNQEGLAFTYQWLRNGLTIEGATSDSYLPEVGDVGASIGARVTASRTGRGTSSASALPVTIQLGASATAVTPPTLRGTAKVGETMTASDGVWSRPGVIVSREWLKNGYPIPGATGPTYTMNANDFDSGISVRVTARQDGYLDGVAESGVVTVAAGGNPAPTSAPTITGVPTPGAWLIAGPGQWNMTGLSFGYQWLRDGSPIAGEADRSYKVTVDDLGHELAIHVTASIPSFESGQATSPSVVPKADALVSARLAKRTIGFGKTGRVIVTVSTDTVRPTGMVQVLSDGVIVGSRPLPSNRQNKVSIRLSELDSGIHDLEVVYSGDRKVVAKSVHLRLLVRDPYSVSGAVTDLAPPQDNLRIIEDR
jgi:hypothetical protein